MVTLILQDSNSALWQVTVDDNGALHVVSVSSGAPLNLQLNDSTNATSWQMGVSTLGALMATLITLNTGLPKTLAMESPTEKTSWNIGVTLQGAWDTTFVANIQDVVTESLTYRYAG